VFKAGTPPLEVVESIRQLAFDPDHFGTTDNYIDWMVDNLSRFHGIRVQITGSTTQERAESLVNELVRHGLVAFR